MTIQRNRFLSQVVEGRRRADALRLAARQEECISKGSAGGNLGDPDVRNAVAHQSGNGTVRDRLHRSRYQLPSPVGCYGEFAEGFHLRANGQAAVLADLQVAGQVHQRPGDNEIAPLIVKIDCGPDRIIGHIHQDQIGSGAGPVGEMCEFQSVLVLSGGGPSGEGANGGEHDEEPGKRTEPCPAQRP